MKKRMISPSLAVAGALAAALTMAGSASAAPHFSSVVGGGFAHDEFGTDKIEVSLHNGPHGPTGFLKAKEGFPKSSWTEVAKPTCMLVQGPDAVVGLLITQVTGTPPAGVSVGAHTAWYAHSDGPAGPGAGSVDRSHQIVFTTTDCRATNSALASISWTSGNLNIRG